MSSTPNPPTMELGDLELELRLLPGVVGVALVQTGDGSAAQVTLLAVSPAPSLAEEAAQLALVHGLEVPLDVVDLGEPSEVADLPSPIRRDHRVALVRAEFLPDTGVCEVELTAGEVRGVGRAAYGPMIGGVVATLDALRQVGTDPPFYLLSAYRVSVGPDAPTVVVLRPVAGGKDRIGIAHREHDVESASRATLSAVNRDLTR
jgi:hypothetical protein